MKSIIKQYNGVSWLKEHEEAYMKQQQKLKEEMYKSFYARNSRGIRPLMEKANKKQLLYEVYY